MASGHPSSCATATLGSVCHCECAGARHSIPNFFPSAVKVAQGGLPGADGTKASANPAPDGLAAEPPGGDLSPDATGGSTGPGMPGGDSGAPASLADLVNSPVTGRESLAPGAVGVVERVSHEGGDEFHKVNRDYDGRSAEESTDAEELAALVGEAMNLPIPRVHRAGPAELHTDWTDGVTGDEHAATLDEDAWHEFTRSDPARLLGIFDLIISNGDRHDGNYMVTDDGQIVGIDHGMAWLGSEPDSDAGDMDAEAVLKDALSGVGSADNPFVEDLMSWSLNAFTGNQTPLRLDFISPRDVAEIRTRLEALRPEFDRLGHGAWLDYSLRVVDALGSLATGTGSIFR